MGLIYLTPVDIDGRWYPDQRDDPRDPDVAHDEAMINATEEKALKGGWEPVG